MAARPEKGDRRTVEGHIIGREAFARISEVEGIRLSDEGRAMFAEFDRLKISNQERRRIIIDRFKRKSEG